MGPVARKPDLIAYECHIVITFSINLDPDQGLTKWGSDLDPNCSIIRYLLQHSDYEQKSSERLVQVATSFDFTACAQKGADRPAHQCSRDMRLLTSDQYTSLIWFKSAQLAEFRYYSFKCFVQRGAKYGFLSALAFLNFIFSAFPNFELKILRN